MRSSNEGMCFTGQVREEQDALVEAVGQEPIAELLQDGHSDTERERGVAQQQRVPQVEDLMQGKDIYKGSTCRTNRTFRVNGIKIGFIDALTTALQSLALIR